MKECDGDTTGPNAFRGTIGKQLQNCEKKPVVKFEPIEFRCNVENLTEISNSLSTDQRYLFDICTSISKGACPLSLANRFPGKICHSRWLTLANRICRLYISTQRPSKILIMLVKFVLWVYAPTHFEVKHRSSCVFGPIHLANVIKASKFLEKKYLNVVQAAISRNAFFAHPENLLLAILNDDDERIRYRGWTKIIQTRNENLSSLRQFQVPALNFDADNYIEMVDWENSEISVPPILQHFDFGSKSARTLANVKLIHHNLPFDLLEVDCHTQATERCVKLVTEASNSVCGEQRRDGHIINTLQSRNAMPEFRIKVNLM